MLGWFINLIPEKSTRCRTQVSARSASQSLTGSSCERKNTSNKNSRKDKPSSQDLDNVTTIINSSSSHTTVPSTLDTAENDNAKGQHDVMILTDQSTNIVEGELISLATPEIEGYTPTQPEIDFTARNTTSIHGYCGNYAISLILGIVKYS